MSMPSYQATHVVPAGGLHAWSNPDPAAAPVDALNPGLDVQVVQRYGGWAQVQCSNGWTCWVDGNALQPIGASAPAPPPPSYSAPSYPAPAYASAARTSTSPVVAPFSILAGGLVALSTFLPWFTFEGLADLNAFKIPSEFLYDIDAGGSGDASLNSVGGLLLLVGIAIAATALVRNRNARRLAGAAAGVVCVDYVIEVLRSLNDAPDAPGLFSVLGFGVYIAVIGAALALADFKATT